MRPAVYDRGAISVRRDFPQPRSYAVPNARIVGIDLGTSNSCIALHVQDKPEVIHNPQGDRTTPSVVAYIDPDKVLVGAPAARQAILNPERTVTGVKRLVGQRFDSDVVSSLLETSPYEVVRARNGDAWVAVGDRVLSPQEIQSHILSLLRSTASAYCGSPIDRAVVTVPAFFDETQRQAVRDAAEIAGLEAVRLLNEPAAVALAHGYGRGESGRVMVVDLGGGTLDVTIMNVEQGRFEVLATDGDVLLGGIDIDRALAERFASEVEADHGVSVTGDAVALQRLDVEAERVKCELTDRERVEVSLPFLAQSSSGRVDFRREVTRDELEQIAQPIVARMLRPCANALGMARCERSDITEVILAGGMTRMPLVQREVERFFGARPSLRVNPDEAVAIGAALLSASLEGRAPEVVFVDVAPRSIGLRTAGDRFAALVRRSTPLPAEAARVFATTRADQRSFQLQVLQGEEEVASKNRRLADISVEPISPGPAGSVKLRVSFSVDEQGRLSVSARELGADTETDVAIRPVSGLGRGEVQRLAAERRARQQGVAGAAEEPAVLAQEAPVVEFSPAPAPAPAPAPSGRGSAVLRFAIAILLLGALGVIGYLLAR